LKKITTSLPRPDRKITPEYIDNGARLPLLQLLHEERLAEYFFIERITPNINRTEPKQEKTGDQEEREREKETRNSHPSPSPSPIDPSRTHEPIDPPPILTHPWMDGWMDG
jgi:hypothetical protein